jgi:hypothetical protein
VALWFNDGNGRLNLVLFLGWRPNSGIFRRGSTRYVCLRLTDISDADFFCVLASYCSVQVKISRPSGNSLSVASDLSNFPRNPLISVLHNRHLNIQNGDLEYASIFPQVYGTTPGVGGHQARRQAIQVPLFKKS